MGSDEIDQVEGITRRDLLKRGARIGGAVWAIPVVQALNMAPAQASGSGYYPTDPVSGDQPPQPTSPSDLS
jgi:hypothetical protein